MFKSFVSCFVSTKSSNSKNPQITKIQNLGILDIWFLKVYQNITKQDMDKKNIFNTFAKMYQK